MYYILIISSSRIIYVYWILYTSSRGGGRSGVCVYRIGGSFPHHPTHHRSQIPISQNPTRGCRMLDARSQMPDPRVSF